MQRGEREEKRKKKEGEREGRSVGTRENLGSGIKSSTYLIHIDSETNRKISFAKLFV